MQSDRCWSVGLTRWATGERKYWTGNPERLGDCLESASRLTPEEARTIRQKFDMGGVYFGDVIYNPSERNP